MDCHTNYVKKTGCSLFNVRCLLCFLKNFCEHSDAKRKKLTLVKSKNICSNIQFVIFNPLKSRGTKCQNYEKSFREKKCSSDWSSSQVIVIVSNNRITF